MRRNIVKIITALGLIVVLRDPPRAMVAATAQTTRSALVEHAAGERRAAEAALVLNQVTVIDVEHGRRWRGQRVVVGGNHIHALGATDVVRVPAGAQVIDARDKYLIPGLWDLHVHAGVGERPAAQVQHAKAVYRLLLANGVTGIRGAGTALPLDAIRVWKREIAAGQRVGPRLLVSGPYFESRRRDCGSGPCMASYELPIARPEEASRLVGSLKAAGVDMLKIHRVPRPIWFAIAAAARRAGIPFGGHSNTGPRQVDSLPKTIDGLVASDSGATILDHELYATICGESGDTMLSLTQCHAAAARLRHNRTWVTPIFGLGSVALPWWNHAALPDSFRQRALRYSPTVRELTATPQPVWRPLTATERARRPTGAEWAAAWVAVKGDSVRAGRGCQVARLAHAADLPWLPGPDSPIGGEYGMGVHLALLMPVLCGVPPAWVLRAATLEPVRALGLADSLGTVETGKVADLVLLDGDPLEDIWNVSRIAAVVANGRYYDRAALDQLLLEARAAWAAIRAPSP